MSEEEGSGNLTNKLYAQLMQDKDFLLTMQPRLYEAKESDDEQEEEDPLDGEEKLSNILGGESALDES